MGPWDCRRNSAPLVYSTYATYIVLLIKWVNDSISERVFSDNYRGTLSGYTRCHRLVQRSIQFQHGLPPGWDSRHWNTLPVVTAHREAPPAGQTQWAEENITTDILHKAACQVTTFINRKSRQMALASIWEANVAFHSNSLIKIGLFGFTLSCL